MTCRTRSPGPLRGVADGGAVRHLTPSFATIGLLATLPLKSLRKSDIEIETRGQLAGLPADGHKGTVQLAKPEKLRLCHEKRSFCEIRLRTGKPARGRAWPATRTV